jgi:hypothetical protein
LSPNSVGAPNQHFIQPQVRAENFDVLRYRMGPNDNYATVSMTHYRTPAYQYALQLFNREHDPRLETARPGLEIYLPPAEVLQRRYPWTFQQSAPPQPQPNGSSIRPVGVPPVTPAVNPAQPSQPFINPAVASGVPTAGEKLYRVRPNDRIWDIARNTLGNGDRWPEILRLNKEIMRDVNQLAPGTTLRLPPDAKVDIP